MISGPRTPSNSQHPSPRLPLEAWIVNVEDLQDKLDAISITSSVGSSASSTSRRVLGPLYNGKFSSTTFDHRIDPMLMVPIGLLSSSAKLLSLSTSFDLDFVFPSLEKVV